ncbi:IbrB-like domain-containing protein [Paenibacillus enshidis]|uniref:IbrB-like domain-containing protein n=1 Tax=Paenibacillus enshidis TaxID=1458439 RepID=A0ABV5AYN0_9BACL
MNEAIVQQAAELFQQLDLLPFEEQVDTINQIKRDLKKHSPFKEEPVDCVVWVPANDVYANTYNPNAVAPPEMKLLETSIVESGYTQPVVTVEGIPAPGKHEVIDGFHRHLVGNKSSKVMKRTKGYLPLAVAGDENMPLEERMAATIRHNRARGSHDVDLMSGIVAELHTLGRSDSWIAKHLGMDADEVLRLKQITGLAAMFKDHDFSKSWE